MRSMDAVLPLSGGMKVFVRVTTVVSPAIGGSRVGCGVGVGAAEAAALPAVVGVALGTAVVVTAAAVGEGEGPLAEPHEEIRITAARPSERPPALRQRKGDLASVSGRRGRVRRGAGSGRRRAVVGRL